MSPIERTPSHCWPASLQDFETASLNVQIDALRSLSHAALTLPLLAVFSDENRVFDRSRALCPHERSFFF